MILRKNFQLEGSVVLIKPHNADIPWLLYYSFAKQTVSKTTTTSSNVSNNDVRTSPPMQKKTTPINFFQLKHFFHRSCRRNFFFRIRKRRKRRRKFFCINVFFRWNGNGLKAHLSSESFFCRKAVFFVPTGDRLVSLKVNHSLLLDHCC